jgi:hypothetical protein
MTAWLNPYRCVKSSPELVFAYIMEGFSHILQLIKVAMCAVWTQKPSPPETGVLMVAHGVRSAARQSFINVGGNFSRERSLLYAR